MKKNKKIPLNDNAMITRFQDYFNKIKSGLEEGKSLYHDGIKNLSTNELQYFDEPDKAAAQILILLTIAIQAYPKNSVEFDSEGTDNDLYSYCKVLETLFSLATLEKMEILSVKGLNSNKIQLDEAFKTTKLRGFI